MNVLDSFGNAYTLQYDSTGYIYDFYDGYLALSRTSVWVRVRVCLQHDPRALYDFDLCEFLEINVETTTDAGVGNGSATATVTGGAEPYAIAWFEGDSEDSFADGMSVDSLLAGEYILLRWTAPDALAMRTL